MNNTMQNYYKSLMPISVPFLAEYPDLTASSITLLLTILLSIGVKESSRYKCIITVSIFSMCIRTGFYLPIIQIVLGLTMFLHCSTCVWSSLLWWQASPLQTLTTGISHLPATLLMIPTNWSRKGVMEVSFLLVYQEHLVEQQPVSMVSLGLMQLLPQVLKKLTESLSS